mmetsp:Transcript_23699/g.55201  ORF Transcript_23699/g.55201 Transcript_23699/m.55201 type:complete len:122 (-) Transcript_23699:448-813(-)
MRTTDIPPHIQDLLCRSLQFQKTQRWSQATERQPAHYDHGSLKKSVVNASSIQSREVQVMQVVKPRIAPAVTLELKYHWSKFLVNLKNLIHRVKNRAFNIEKNRKSSHCEEGLCPCVQQHP